MPPAHRPAPLSQVCREKRRLAEAIIAAADEILSLTQREIGLIMTCPATEELVEIETRITQAVRFKASVIERYENHVRAHGC